MATCETRLSGCVGAFAFMSWIAALAPGGAHASNSLGLVAWDTPTLTLTCADVTSDDIDLPLLTQFFGSLGAFVNPPRCSSWDVGAATIAAPVTGMPFAFVCTTQFGGEAGSTSKTTLLEVPFTQFLADQPVRSYRLAWQKSFFGTAILQQDLNMATISGPGIPAEVIPMASNAGTFRRNIEPLNQHIDYTGTFGFKAFVVPLSPPSTLTVSAQIHLSGSVVEDINEDGSVDGGDLGLLLGAWGTDDDLGDLDDSGMVDGGDLGKLLGAWTG